MKLFVGFGFSGDPDLDVVKALIGQAVQKYDLHGAPITALATIDTRQGHWLPQALSQALNVPVRYFSPLLLECETPRLRNPSEALFRKIGCHGVAEASALAAGGPQAELLMEKMKAGTLTLALAFTSET